MVQLLLENHCIFSAISCPFFYIINNEMLLILFVLGYNKQNQLLMR